MYAIFTTENNYRKVTEQKGMSPNVQECFDSRNEWITEGFTPTSGNSRRRRGRGTKMSTKYFRA